ncbi:MAG: hypothetical protein AABN33_18180 [Acidobacteriota bacterium]
MSDIIVRIPARQMRHFVEDKMTSTQAFWRMIDCTGAANTTPSGRVILKETPRVEARQLHILLEGSDMLSELGFGLIGLHR